MTDDPHTPRLGDPVANDRSTVEQVTLGLRNIVRLASTAKIADHATTLAEIKALAGDVLSAQATRDLRSHEIQEREDGGPLHRWRNFDASGDTDYIPLPNGILVRTTRWGAGEDGAPGVALCFVPTGG